MSGNDGPTVREEGEDYLEQLEPIDGAPSQFVVNDDVGRHGRRSVECAQVLGMRVDHRGVGSRLYEVAQGLDAARRRARPDRYEIARLLTDLEDAGNVGLGGDRTFDQ